MQYLYSPHDSEAGGPLDKRSGWWLFDSVTALNTYVLLVSAQKVKEEIWVFISFTNTGREEDARFPSSLLMVMVVYGLVNSLGKTQLKFSRPKPRRQLQQPLNSWVSPISPSPNCVSEGGAHGDPRIPASKISHVCKSTQSVLWTEKGFLISTFSIKAGPSLYSYPT